MSQHTLDRPQTVTICDIKGVEQSMLHIEGKPLEEYFADAGLAVPIDDQITIVDDMPADLKAPVSPGAYALVGIIPTNG